MDTFVLENGVKIPKIGFGSYKSVTEEKKDTILKALKAGYRHIDTAWIYGNQQEIGDSLKKSGIPRKELFLTSKIHNEHLGYAPAMQDFSETLRDLQTDYVDLLLIHWPKSCVNDKDWKEKDLNTWRALEELYQNGKARAIGVSNFLPHHLEPLLQNARIKPMVNQIEFHPGYLQKFTVDYCSEQGILVEAWSPLGRSRMLKEELVKHLAEKYGKSPAQICIRFCLEWGILPLPKASSKERMEENLNVFDFSLKKEDLYQLAELPQVGWSGEHPDRERIFDGVE